MMAKLEIGMPDAPMSDGSKMSDAAKSSMGMGVDAGWGALKS